MPSSPITNLPGLDTTVWATVDLPGFHHWPAATARRAYLADTHRHLFRVTAEVRVDHTDRDVEFHDLGDLIREWWRSGDPGPSAGPQEASPTRDWGSCSCEAIGETLWQTLVVCGLDPVEVAVSEDGEFGARLRRVAGHD